MQAIVNSKNVLIVAILCDLEKFIWISRLPEKKSWNLSALF